MLTVPSWSSNTSVVILSWNKLHAKLCWKPSWSLWRHGRGRAGAGDISHRGFVGWRSALWWSSVLLSLPLLQRCSSRRVASNCSEWFSAWTCLGDWWGWSFGSSGTAAGCLSWEVWWLRTGCMRLAILQSARSYCRLSREQWIHPLHLHGPVLLGCCRLSRLPFLQWLYCSLHFFAKDVVVCVSLGTVQYWWISIGLLIVQLSAVFCPSVQYLSFFYEAFSWSILDGRSFSLFHSFKSFTSWYALLLLFFLRYPSISLHCSPIQFSCAIFYAPLDVVVHLFYTYILCWKRLSLGGWWWAFWRLGDIPWQCSRCPCEQEIQRHARVYPFSTEENFVSFLGDWETRGGREHNIPPWSSPSSRGRSRTEKNGEYWFWSHLWCPDDPRVYGKGEGNCEAIEQQFSPACIATTDTLLPMSRRTWRICQMRKFTLDTLASCSVEPWLSP